MTSPIYRHGRSSLTGLANMKRPQNTKAAAQRLAQVMAHQPADDEDDEDDPYDFEPAIPSVGIGLAGGRQTRNRPQIPVRTSVEQPTSVRSASSAKASITVTSVGQKPSVSSTLGSKATSISSVDLKPVSTRSASSLRPSNLRPVEPLLPVQSPIESHPCQSTELTEETPSPLTNSDAAGRSSSYFNSLDQPPSARSSSLGHSNLVVKTTSTVPPTVPVSNKIGVSGKAVESLSGRARDKRFSLDFGTFKYKEPSDQQSSSALQDELDMLQEENDNLLAKMRIAKERYEESEARVKQLENQIASLGGVSLEARLLNRKEAELQKREAALKVATQTYGGGGEEIAALRIEAEIARDEAKSALEQLQDIASEAKSLRTITRRMILTQEEMEEVVLKRCWLARSWSICLRYGIHAEIAGYRYEYWSAFASSPVETIMAAGQKAKDENLPINNDLKEREKILHETNDISKKGNVESMLLVEKGLRELTSLKVEEAIAISMALKRRPSISNSNIRDELRLPTDSQYFSESFELSQEESEDVLLKQAWLAYFWRRAKNHGLEPDIAEEKLQLWISKGQMPMNSNDAVDAERGIMELRKLGIETKLWEETRRKIDPDFPQETLLGTEL